MKEHVVKQLRGTDGDKNFATIVLSFLLLTCAFPTPSLNDTA